MKQSCGGMAGSGMHALTVIICTRNRARSLASSLKSLAAMDMHHEAPIEVIVVNNGSTDRTVHFVRDFKTEALFPALLVDEPQPGLSRARNSGLRAAQNALSQCLSTVNADISGWGIDHLWPSCTGQTKRSIGIIDTVQVTHTRPVANPNNDESNYVFMRGTGTIPREEAVKLLSLNKLADKKFQINEILFKSGIIMSSDNLFTKKIIILIYKISILLAYLTRNPRRWDIDYMLTTRMKEPFSSPAP